MEMTIVEKILGKSAGEIAEFKPDFCMINDDESHRCVELIAKANKIALKEHVIVILDHDIPAGSFDSAANQKKLIDFSRKYDLAFVQSAGIGYQVLLDSYIKPGSIIVSCGIHNSFFGSKGALGLNLSVNDMATLLIKGSISMKVPKTVNIALKGKLPEGVSAIDFILKLLAETGAKGFDEMVIEFTGDAIEELSLSDRIVICSMAMQTGAVSAFINEVPKGRYIKNYVYDLSKVTPTVTLPGDLYTAKSVEELKGVAIHAGFIGGCMGGRIEDLRIAANILNGNKVKLGVRLLIGFASNSVYLQAMEEGLVEIFLNAGAQVTNPGCGSCKTTSIGVVGDGEVLITTGSYNYPGCSGTEDSKVYIASAATVANAAVKGYIC